MLIVGFICLLIAMSIVASIVIWSVKTGISPMPTSKIVKKAILRELPEDLTGPIYELGAGWGTLAYVLADKYPNSKIEAFEISPIPYAACRIRQWITPKPNLKFHRQDFFSVPLRNASVVVCYLYPGAMEKLALKLSEELQKGSIVISNTFAVTGWKPSHTIQAHDLYNTNVYVYVVEAKG